MGVKCFYRDNSWDVGSSSMKIFEKKFADIKKVTTFAVY